MLINILHPAFTSTFYLPPHLDIFSNSTTSYPLRYRPWHITTTTRLRLRLAVFSTFSTAIAIACPWSGSYLLPPVYINTVNSDVVWSNGLLLWDVLRDYSEWP